MTGDNESAERVELKLQSFTLSGFNKLWNSYTAFV